MITKVQSVGGIKSQSMMCTYNMSTTVQHNETMYNHITEHLTYLNNTYYMYKNCTL